MTGINLLPMEPGVFSVEVVEGHERTAHRLVVPDGFLEDLGLVDVDRAKVARETIGFLLDRVPSTAVPDELTLYDVAEEHPDFGDELLTRLGIAPP